MGLQTGATKLLGSMTMYLVLVLALAVGALAQVPVTCPGPKQFEGRFRRFDRERKYEVQGAIIYDGDLKKVREFEDESIAGNKQVLLKLKLYNENKEYVLDLKTRKCNVSAPHHGFHPYGVPPGSVFKADAIVGASGVTGESLTVAEFEYDMENSTSKFFVRVSEPHCFPIAHAFVGKDGMELTEFFDAQEGIRTPDAWDIPKECASL